MHLLVRIIPGVVRTRHVTKRPGLLPTTFCKRVLGLDRDNVQREPRLRDLTSVFMAAVRLICLVVAVWMTVTHRHRQQTAAAVTHELFSGAALWGNTQQRKHAQMHMNANGHECMFFTTQKLFFLHYFHGFPGDLPLIITTPAWPQPSVLHIYTE